MLTYHKRRSCLKRLRCRSCNLAALDYFQRSCSEEPSIRPGAPTAARPTRRYLLIHCTRATPVHIMRSPMTFGDYLFGGCFREMPGGLAAVKRGRHAARNKNAVPPTLHWGFPWVILLRALQGDVGSFAPLLTAHDHRFGCENRACG